MSEPTRKSTLIASLQSILDASIQRGTPGASACISTSTTRIWTTTSGLSSLTSHPPSRMQPTHLLGIGSITKLFISVLILQLIDSPSNALSLSSTLGSLLPPKMIEKIENAEEATMESLLRHMSGVDSWEDDEGWIREGRGESVVVDKIWGKEETLGYIRRAIKNPEEVRKGVFSYSNSNFTLLGLVVEKITGSTVEVEIRKKILEPLGMNDTYLEGFEQIPDTKQISARYHYSTPSFLSTAGISPSFPPVPNRSDLIDASASNLSVEWAAGGLLSTPSDLCTFALSLPTLLSPSSLQKMQDWKPAHDNMEIGLGVFRMTTERHGRWLCHFGGVLGYSATVMWREDGDCAISVISNVGTMHCGTGLPVSAVGGILKSDFLSQAVELAAVS